MSDDDRGVMGNLPRSRPGTRSAKRKSAGTPSGGASRAKSGPKPAARSKSSSSSARKTPAKPRTAAARPARPRPEPSSRRPDPVAEVVRLGVKVAGAGLGVAASVLKRLPRP
ncbi:MAG: hypothetical protein QOD53_84 [Thermoleophilaceae bacterium]|jgi:hypothetical protein|nr:hypothetical protein [Thermoleophilaceae bacterium]